MLAVALLAALAGLLVSFIDWRRGVLVALAVGFLQDPARKLVPGEPVYFVVAFAPFFAAALAGALASGMRPSLRPLFRWHPELRAPIIVFVVIVALQMGVTLLSTGNVMLAGIGGIAYYTPLVGLLFAFWYGQRPRNVVAFTRGYVVMATLMLTGVYLAVWGIEWRVLESVGSGLYIYPEAGGRLELPAGFFRIPENAAWHGAAALCLLIVLVVGRGWRSGLATAVPLGLLIVVAVILTGRRKMVVEMVLFVLLYSGLLMYFRRGAVKLAAFLASLGVITVLVQALLFPEENQATYRPYFERTTTVVEEASDRLEQMTVSSFTHVVRVNGLLGSGAGLGSQGAQHFGGGVRMVGYAAEGGLAKILAELGVPGLLACVWVAVALARSAWKGLRASGQVRSGLELDAVGLGIAAFLMANAAVYVTAFQIFGDPFVLLVLGMLLGFLLAAPAATHAGRSPGAARRARPGAAHAALPGAGPGRPSGSG